MSPRKQNIVVCWAVMAVASGLLSTNMNPEPAAIPYEPNHPPPAVEVSTEPETFLPAIFERIAGCETWGDPAMPGTHWADANGDPTFENTGRVLTGRATADIGLYQINPVHLPDAQRLGLDIFTPAGNEAYAHILYEQRAYYCDQCAGFILSRYGWVSVEGELDIETASWKTYYDDQIWARIYEMTSEPSPPKGR